MDGMKETEAKVKTTVEIPEKLWRAAKDRALDNRSTMAAVIIEALEKLFGKKGASHAR